MKELELEAEKYTTSKEWSNNKPETWVQDIFIAGATSKYVEKQIGKQKLEFAIEQLEEFKCLSSSIMKKIKELKQKLSEL